jgi:hypothetical protein
MKQKIYFSLTIILLIILIWTRIQGLNWGFPYLFHPDENNIAFSVNQLKCVNIFSRDCLDPNFYAYGQLTIYAAYFISKFLLAFDLFTDKILAISYSLRLISAVCSIIAGILILKITKNKTKSTAWSIIALWLFIFTPGLIQSSHFGTTENVLIMSLLAVIYFEKQILSQAFFIGLAVAAKPTGIVLLVFCFIERLTSGPNQPRRLIRALSDTLQITMISLFGTIIFSPHYLINFSRFWQTFSYEMAVAKGIIPIFYTEQFRQTWPFIFQLKSIFPYTLGFPLLAMGLLSLPFLFKKNQALIWFFIIFLLWQSFLFVKWTRFMAPLFAVFILLFVIFFQLIISKFKPLTFPLRFILVIFILYQTIIGYQFLHIYQTKDLRIQATDWINQHLPKNSFIISEAANVVNLPLNSDRFPNYRSYFLYDLDSNIVLAKTVFTDLKRADYVIIPSRRIFSNYRQNFPVIQKYYQEVMKSSRFQLIKEFTAGLNDEQAEETVSVFDHPKIRIYQRN